MCRVVAGVAELVTHLTSKVAVPKHWNLSDAITVRNNMWDFSAKLILGDDDEAALCTKFAKLKGPNARELRDVNACLKSLGDAEAKVYDLEVKKMTAETQDDNGVGIALQENERTRRRQVAQKALSKRGAKRNFSAIATMALVE